MAAFNPTQHQAVSDELTRGMRTAHAKLAKVRPAAKATGDHWYVPDHVATMAISLADKIADIGQAILNKIKEILEGIAAPVLFFGHASDWQDHVRGKASSVAGNTTEDALMAPKVWGGKAADDYVAAVKDQTKAATQIATSADKIGTALTWCAVSGAAFYIALAIVLGQLIATLTAAAVALGSLVFSWAGVLMALGDMAASSAAVYAAITALVAALATQAQQMSTVKGEASDNSAFPRGQWPSGTN